MSFLLLLFILDMQFFWLYLDDLLGKGLPWYVIVELLFYASANVVPMALPLAVLLSSTMTFGNLAESLELTALKASGLSFLRIARPLIVLIFLIAGFAFYFSNTLWPTANFQLKALLTDIYNKNSSLIIREGSFSTEIDHFGIRAAAKNAETGELFDVLIYDRTGNLNPEGNDLRIDYRDDPRDYHREIRSESGLITNSPNGAALMLNLHNGQITEELNPKKFDGLKKPFWKIDFKKTTLNIDLSSQLFERQDLSTWGESLEWMSVKQLAYTYDSIQKKLPEQQKSTSNFIVNQTRIFRDTIQNKALGKDHFFMTALSPAEQKKMIEHALNRSKSQLQSINIKTSSQQSKKRDINRIIGLTHQKFTLSVACIILFFIGASLGAIVKKGGLGMPVLITIILFIFYYVLLEMGKKMSYNEVLSPIVGMWLSAFILAPIALFLTRKANRDSSILEFDFYKRLFSGKRKNEDSSTVQ